MIRDASGALSRPILFSFLAGVAVLYALGLNPFVMPESTDDITYFELAKSLAEGRGYTFLGEVIPDWPPVYPVIIAVFLSLGMTSLVWIKALSIVMALISLWLGYRIMLTEKRPFPALSILLLALFPTCFLYAVRTASEWPYIIASFGFFLVLHRMRTKATWQNAIILGLLLGIAALTRMVGVILGTAIIYQMLQKWWALRKENPTSDFKTIVKTIGAECLAAFIGATIFLAWRLYLASEADAGNLAVGNYDLKGQQLWTYFDPMTLLANINELFFQIETVFGKFGASGLIKPATLLIGILLAIGLWQRIRKRCFLPSDVYAIAILLLLVSYEYQTTRFMIAIAPFLLSWLFNGLEWSFSLVRLPHHKLLPAICGIWALGLLAIDGYLIIRGNDKNHGPLSGLISKDEDKFYKGLYADIRDACERVAKEDPEAAIGIYGWYANYVYVFTGGQAGINYLYPQSYSWFIETFEDQGVLPPLVETGFEKVETYGGATLYRLK